MSRATWQESPALTPGRTSMPNAWDVVSARLVEEAGASAIATTSAGVAARISLGSSIAEAAYAVARRAARELLTTGTYESLTGALDYGRLNALLGSRPEGGSTR